MNLISLFVVAFSLISAGIYYLVPAKGQHLVLSTLSLLFFAIYSPIGAGIVIVETLLALLFSTAIGKAQNQKVKKVWLWGAVIFFVAAQILVKYIVPEGNSTFFETLSISDTAISIGCSYFLLRFISYIVDVYSSKTVPETNLFKLLLYIAYFPAILQGPIERYDSFKQKACRKEKISLTYDNVRNCVISILIGLFKVNVISAFCGLFTPSLNSFEKSSSLYLIMCALLYSIQIYAEFSGGIEIARGISYLFGIELVRNFNKPYFSQSFSEFWKRWHMSFSSWLKDYIYIPLGGSRKGISRKYLNLLIVFAFSGIWHNATLTFLIWGLLQALYQIIDTKLKFRSKKYALKRDIPLPLYFLNCAITFILSTFSWLFFNASSLENVIKYFKIIFKPFFSINEIVGLLLDFKTDLLDSNMALKGILIRIGLIAICCLLEFLDDRYGFCFYDKKRKTVVRWAFYTVLFVTIILFGNTGSFDSSSFIYGAF